MSRCHQTDALLDATLVGTDLSRNQAAHAVHCAECARVLSEARRFDGALTRTGVELSPEPMPDAAELIAVDAAYRKEGRLMTVRRGLVGGAATAVVIGVVLVGVSWLSRDVGVGGVGGAPPAVGLSGDFDGWLQAAEDATAASTGDIFAGDAPRLVRVEDCGRDFTAMLEDDGSHEFSWVSGPKEDGSEATGGVSRDLYSIEVARERAADDVLCERIVEATISRTDAAEAVDRMGGIPGDARVEAASLLEPGTAMVLMEGSVDFWSEEQWWIGPLHRSPDGWSGNAEEWIGTNLPDGSGGLKYIPANTMASGWPETNLLVTVLPDPAIAVAVELDLDGVPHRYHADPGESTLIIGLPDLIARPIPVRFIAPDGMAFGEHRVEP